MTRMPLTGAGGALAPFDFDLGAVAFTAAMAIRADPSGLWDGAPVVQGKWDSTGTCDVLSLTKGSQVGNPTGVVYETMDPNQGSIEFIITPEWDGDDGLNHGVFYPSPSFQIRKHADNKLRFYPWSGTYTSVDVSGWTAGTSYYVVCRWDVNNTLDGTNYASISIDDVHTFGSATQPSAATPSTMYVGLGASTSSPSNAVIAGFKIWDIVFFDGTYGNAGASMGVDLVAQHAAGENVAQYIAAYGCKLGLPTDATPAALTTTGQAYSMPVTELKQGDVWDGGYLGGPYMVYFDGTDDEVNFGSDASLDDIPSGASITVEGIWRCDDVSNSPILIGKTNGSIGWLFNLEANNIYAGVFCDTTNAYSRVAKTSFALPNGTFEDGKCHHLAFVYDDTGDKKLYIAVDGVWASAYAAQQASVGAYSSDAALNLYTGERQGSAIDFEGAHGWLRLSNNRRYTPGTDFIAPTDLPAADGNTIEQWTVAQGTGNLTAVVNSPANDGVPTGATWIPVWDQSGSPVLSQCLKFEQENDGIDYGSGANIDDLPSADCTIEFWARIPPDITSNSDILCKEDASRTTGWTCRALGGYTQFWGQFATNDLSLNSPTTVMDDQWHHHALDWDFGTLTGRYFVDGVLSDTDTAVGAYQADAADDCLVNSGGAIGTRNGNIAIGWLALSDTRRYTGASFVPPDRHNCPANDANYQLLCDMTDGAGTTVTDSSGNAYNGTVTFGATTRWINDQDVEAIAPGHQIYNGRGLVLGSDDANDGLVHLHTVTAGDDLVVRAVASTGNDGVGAWQLRVRDETGAADIVTVKFPQMVGTHDGGNNEANLSDSGARWLNNQIFAGWTVYNVTDDSSEVLEANPCDGAGTTITTTLAGGTDNDWDDGDVYMLKPPRSYRDCPMVLQFCCKAPAGCTSMGFYAEETGGSGTLYLHRLDVHENSLAGGDMDAGAGNPWIPTGWSNINLDPGDTQASSAGAGIIHTGTDCAEFLAGTVSEGFRQIPAGLTEGDFGAFGGWGYSTSGNVALCSSGSTQMYHERGDDLVGTRIRFDDAFWVFESTVARGGASATPYAYCRGGTTGVRYLDDVFFIALDAVTLTVTAATEPNSLESSGIRVDGYDSCTQVVPVGAIKSTVGKIRWKWRPRHGDADAVKFGNATPRVFTLRPDANNYIELEWTAANNLRLTYNANGAGAQVGNWATGGGAIVPDAEYEMEIRYSGSGVKLYVGGVERIDIVAATGFVWPAPSTVYWGSRGAGDRQTDAVYIAP